MMRRDPDGTLWLTWDEWELRERRRVASEARDAPSETPEPSQAELDRLAREDAKHWRAGRGKGLLAATSPLSAERRRKGENA
jgi:hypothetical protein